MGILVMFQPVFLKDDETVRQCAAFYRGYGLVTNGIDVAIINALIRTCNIPDLKIQKHLFPHLGTNRNRDLDAGADLSI
jgi:hypothetical protein